MPRYKNGDIIQGYKITHHIREGAYADAYKAEKNGTPYFFKEYTDPVNNPLPEFKKQFEDFKRQQHDICDRLKSAKLLCVEELLETFDHKFRYHQIKPLYECTNLAEYLKSNYDLEDRLFICRNWLGVLREVNRLGVVHQDLNPSQILMIKDPKAGRLGYRLLFADFDWAIIDGRELKPVHTPGYATPEHFCGKPRTPASDLYQTGVVLYQLMTERLPFYREGEVYNKVIDIYKERMQKEEITPPHEIQPVVPKNFSDNIMRMLRWDPASRPSVDELIESWDKKSALLATPKATSAPSLKAMPGWMRLKHSTGLSMTISDNELPVTRVVFHRSFRSVLSPSKNRIAAYFPSDDVTPLFTIRKGTDGWQIEGGSHRNHVRVDGKKIDSKSVLIPDGGTVEIFAEKEGIVVGEFSVEYGE